MKTKKEYIMAKRFRTNFRTTSESGQIFIVTRAMYVSTVMEKGNSILTRNSYLMFLGHTKRIHKDDYLVYFYFLSLPQNKIFYFFSVNKNYEVFLLPFNKRNKKKEEEIKLNTCIFSNNFDFEQITK
jgi:hypothetical protein